MAHDEWRMGEFLASLTSLSAATVAAYRADLDGFHVWTERAGGHALTLSEPTALPRFLAEGSPVAATRYRVASPADPPLLNGNRLCGGKTPAPVTYIVLWTPQELAGDTAPRSLAAFSGPTPPTGTDSPGLCGTFRYEAGPAAR